MKTLSDIIWNDENEENNVSVMSMNRLSINCSSGQPKKEANVANGYWCLRVPTQNFVPGLNCEAWI